MHRDEAIGEHARGKIDNVTGSVRLDDTDELGYARTLSFIDDAGAVLWSSATPTSAPDDAWTGAEVRGDQVLGWTWSCQLVTFDRSGVVLTSVFTK